MTTSILTTIETDAEGFFKGVVTDLKTWAGDVETVVVDDAKVGWVVLWPILSAIGPAQWKILQGLVATVNKDIAADDYTGVVSDVLSQAAAQELAWIATIPPDVLLVITTALKGSAPAAAT